MSDIDNEVIEEAKRRLGQVLSGKWTLDSVLGVGGMATVYAATHRNRKRAAVKLLHPQLSMNSNIRERFLREGYVANTIAHPGVLTVDDDDATDEGTPYLVMELLQGESLGQRWLRKGKSLPIEEVMGVTYQVLGALSAAHDNNVIHRDLKPDNLFLTADGRVKILDFGIARLRETGGSNPQTQTGWMMGTPQFAPPEQARGRWDDVDGRTDLWAIGATMYTLLTGRMVHEAETPAETLAAAMFQPAPSVTTVAPDLEPAIAHLIDKALQYEKADRWPDANAFREALLAAAQATEPPIAILESPPISQAMPLIGTELGRARGRDAVAAAEPTPAEIALAATATPISAPQAFAATAASDSIAPDSERMALAATATPASHPDLMAEALSSQAPKSDAQPAASPRNASDNTDTSPSAGPLEPEQAVATLPQAADNTEQAAEALASPPSSSRAVLFVAALVILAGGSYAVGKFTGGKSEQAGKAPPTSSPAAPQAPGEATAGDKKPAGAKKPAAVNDQAPPSKSAATETEPSAPSTSTAAPEAAPQPETSSPAPKNPPPTAPAIPATAVPSKPAGAKRAAAKPAATAPAPTKPPAPKAPTPAPPKPAAKPKGNSWDAFD